jgi:xanthine dehydrogenase YagS FAD-binding subunit
MKPFEMIRPRTVGEAAKNLGTERDRAKLIAGGTDLLGEMKDYLVSPARLVNLKSVPNLGKMEWSEKTGAKFGALVTLSQIAENAKMREVYPALTEAIALSAMPQIRNAATIAGNLCQRPRCWYYRDEEIVCLKKGGDKCYAVEGENQYHAILGGGPCYIVHPSDPACPLVAYGASVVISDGANERTVPLEQFFVLPKDNVYRENILKQNEVITHITIPPPLPGTRATYVKEREKDSYDWSIGSVAAVITRDGQGKVTNARIVLGGVAPVPWRATEAEKAFIGKTADDGVIAEAARAALSGAKPLEKNAYKVPLTEAVVRRALARTMA